MNLDVDIPADLKLSVVIKEKKKERDRFSNFWQEKVRSILDGTGDRFQFGTDKCQHFYVYRNNFS